MTRLASMLVLPAVTTGIVLLLLPLLAPSSYDLNVFTTFCENLLLLTGLNIISGYGGQLSLGQAALYGVGAYTVTIGTLKLGLSPVLCFFLAPLVAAAFAVAVAIPSLRLRGLYFAMATLGVGVIFQLFLDRAVNITGGPNGVGVKPLHVLGVDFAQPRSVYVAAGLLAWAGVLVSQLFLATNIGWGLRAAHASEPAAAVVGVNTYAVRLVAMAVSGVYAGIAGGIQAFNSLYVSPTTFNFFTSVILFIVLTIGGLATWAGPVFGALLLLVFDRWLPQYSDKEPLILAVIFVLALRLFPRGVARSVAAGFARTRAVRTAPRGERLPAPGDNA